MSSNCSSSNCSDPMSPSAFLLQIGDMCELKVYDRYCGSWFPQRSKSFTIEKDHPSLSNIPYTNKLCVNFAPARKHMGGTPAVQGVSSRHRRSRYGHSSLARRYSQQRRPTRTYAWVKNLCARTNRLRRPKPRFCTHRSTDFSHGRYEHHVVIVGPNGSPSLFGSHTSSWFLKKWYD